MKKRKKMCLDLWGTKFKISLRYTLLLPYCLLYSEIFSQETDVGLPWWSSGWEFACQWRGHGFDHWSGKIPHAVEQLSLSSTTVQPALQSQNSAATESCMPQSRTREANKRSYCNEKSAHLSERGAPACCNQRKSACSNNDPAWPKQNKTRG